MKVLIYEELCFIQLIPGQEPDHYKKVRTKNPHLKSKCVPIYYIGLKSSMGIFGKSHKLSAFNFDPWFMKVIFVDFVHPYRSPSH